MFAAVTVYAAAAGDRFVVAVIAVGAAGCAVVAVGLLLRVALVLPWGAALVGAAYAMFLSLRRGSVDANAVYISAALIVACELAFLSVRTTAGAVERRARGDAAIAMCALAFATLVAGEFVLVASGQTTSRLVFEPIGAACAVVVIAALVRVAASRSRGSTST